MAYQLKEGESHVEHCFECKEAFELTPEHEQYYADSSLCPACYEKAMITLHGGDLEYYHTKMLESLDKIVADIKGINECIKIICEDYKKGR